MNAYEKNVCAAYDLLRADQERQGFAISRKAPMDVFSEQIHERLIQGQVITEATTVEEVEIVLERLRAQGYL